jgi:hypothetical protein
MRDLMDFHIHKNSDDIVLFVIAALFLACCATSFHGQQTLKCAGRTLDQWLVDLDPSSAPETRLRARAAINGLGASAVKPLIRKLISAHPSPPSGEVGRLRLNDAYLAVQGLEALGPVAEPAFPYLKRLARNVSTSYWVLLAMIAIRPRETFPVITNLLAQSNPDLQIAALDGLARLGTNATEPLSVLGPCLHANNPIIRALAVRAAEATANGSSELALLTNSLADPEPSVRLFAVRALGPLMRKDRGVRFAVNQLTSDPSEIVQIAAKKALTELSRYETGD